MEDDEAISVTSSSSRLILGKELFLLLPVLDADADTDTDDDDSEDDEDDCTVKGCAPVFESVAIRTSTISRSCMTSR